MSYDSQKPSIGKRGGEFIILSIYLFGDVWEFWNVNHLLCLFLGGLGIFSLIWYDDALSPRQLIYVAASLVLIALVADWVSPPILREETEAHGWLIPANDPTPQNACSSMPQLPNTTMIIMGNSAGAIFGEAKTNALVIGNCISVSVEKTKDGVYINSDNYDPQGNLISRIERNEFHIIGNQIAYSERPDRSTLRVIGTKGNEIFWVRYANSSTVLVRGIFGCENHQPYEITNERLARVGAPAGAGLSRICVGAAQTLVKVN